MKRPKMYYLSAALAILGAVGYQYFVKRVPGSISPLISVIGLYTAVIGLAVVALPFFRPEGGLLANIKQLSWIQIALAVSVFFIEIGFLLMYRAGWDLSAGNLVTGVFVNILLVGLGVALLGEKLNAINIAGIVLSIIGVALISYKS